MCVFVCVCVGEREREREREERREKRERYATERITDLHSTSGRDKNPPLCVYLAPPCFAQQDIQVCKRRFNPDHANEIVAGSVIHGRGSSEHEAQP